MKCSWCNEEMKDESIVTCKSSSTSFPDGVELDSIPYTDVDRDRRCHDCGVKVGGYHHPGCDMERCPRCKGQLIGCRCGMDERWLKTLRS